MIENLKLRNMRLNFKKYMAGLATAATLLLTACYEDHTDLEDRTTRIRISPEIEAFEADGTASVSGNSNVTSVVLVKVGTRVSRMEWEAELVDWMPSVDETGPWATIQRVPVVSQYTEIAGPNTVAVTQSGFELTALPNTGYGRRCTVRITAEDGTVQDYELFQYGELADAEVVPALESVEISFQGDPVDLAYTTNMGDKYAYAIAYEEGGAEGWLTAEHRGEGLLTLTAEPWDDMERDRRATLTITVGDDETSKAAVDIPVVQLRKAEYYYVYGSALGEEAATALQMKRESDDSYRVSGFFFATEDNLICINKDSRAGDPSWYLGADGELKNWARNVTASDLKIEANGGFRCGYVELDTSEQYAQLHARRRTCELSYEGLPDGVRRSQDMDDRQPALERRARHRSRQARFGTRRGLQNRRIRQAQRYDRALRRSQSGLRYGRKRRRHRGTSGE